MQFSSFPETLLVPTVVTVRSHLGNAEGGALGTASFPEGLDHEIGWSPLPEQRELQGMVLWASAPSLCGVRRLAARQRVRRRSGGR